MTMTALAVISPVVATTRLLLVVACVPNLFFIEIAIAFLSLSWLSFST